MNVIFRNKIYKTKMANFEIGLKIHLILFSLFIFSFQQIQKCQKNTPIKYKMDAF